MVNTYFAGHSLVLSTGVWSYNLARSARALYVWTFLQIVSLWLLSIRLGIGFSPACGSVGMPLFYVICSLVSYHIHKTP